MITRLPVGGNANSGASRRRLYRQSKRVLTRLLGRRWSGPRWTLEPTVRRFLRARSRSYLARLLRDRAFALAAVVSLATTGTAGALPPIELSDIAAGTGGFVINGIDPNDRSGYSVSGAGDVNGDGVPDVIVGAPDSDPNGINNAGESYVVLGPTACPPDFNGDGMANANDVNDFIIAFLSGAPEADFNGDGVINANDVNDFIIAFLEGY